MCDITNDYFDRKTSIVLTNRQWQYIVTALQLSCGVVNEICDLWRQLQALTIHCSDSMIPAPTPQQYDAAITKLTTTITDTTLIYKRSYPK